MCICTYAYQDFEVANVTNCFVIFITIICTGDDLVSLHLQHSERHFVYSHMVCVKQNNYFSVGQDLHTASQVNV